MKLNKRQLKRIIREEKTKLLRESSGIDDYEKLVGSRRSQHSMGDITGKEMDSARLESISDELMIYMDLQDEPELVREVAQAILDRLKADNLC